MDEEPSIQRRLAAILAADIAGYSRLMHEDEPATVRDLKAHQSVILPLVGRHGGRIIDTAGDGIMAEFPSVIGATECAVAIQTAMAERNEGVPEGRRMRFRIGINLGDVIHDDARIYGDGINLAARLEALAEPGGVLVSNTVYDQVRASCRSPSRMWASGRSRTSSSPCGSINSTFPEHRPTPWRSSSSGPPSRIEGVGSWGGWRRSWFSSGREELGGCARPCFQVGQQTAQRPRVSQSSCCPLAT
jgi:hypothetical protein